MRAYPPGWITRIYSGGESPVGPKQNTSAASRLFALIASCVAALCLMVSDGDATRAQVPDERPNIVFILTDDMDKGLLGYMPVVERELTGRGVSFDNALVTLPVCCPSRATTLTGQYAHNHEVYTNAAPHGGEAKFRGQGDQSTIALWLQSSGYKTGLVGKYLNQYDDTYIPPGWTQWYATVGNGGGTNGDTLNQNGKLRTFNKYPTDLYRSKAVRFIENAEEPFFLWVGFNAPHSPAHPATRHADMFNDLKVPRPPSFNEKDVSDKPLWVRSLPRLKGEDVGRLTRFQRNRARSLQAVDEAVGAIMNKLEEQGELENTYIVFTSDNGLNMGEHRWTKKSAPYEESVSVPLVIRGPGVEEGVVREHIVTNNDLAPTFAAWGQSDIPDSVNGDSFDVDGKSFDGLLGPAPPASADWRRATLIERLVQSTWSPDRPDKDMPPYAALRTENQTYIKYSTGELEFYNNFRKDPYQLRSRHATASPEVVARFDNWLEALRDCSGEVCRSAEEQAPQ